MNKDMKKIEVRFAEYFSIPIETITIDDEAFWLGRSIGRALGYARNGEKLVRNIRRRWTRDFAIGIDYVDLTADTLERVRGLIPRLRRTRRVMLLSRQGLTKVLARASFDIAQPLAAWIDGGRVDSPSLGLAETISYQAPPVQHLSAPPPADYSLREHLSGLSLDEIEGELMEVKLGTALALYSVLLHTLKQRGVDLP